MESLDVAGVLQEVGDADLSSVHKSLLLQVFYGGFSWMKFALILGKLWTHFFLECVLFNVAFDVSHFSVYDWKDLTGTLPLLFGKHDQ